MSLFLLGSFISLILPVLTRRYLVDIFTPGHTGSRLPTRVHFCSRCRFDTANNFFLNNQREALIVQIYCYKTLHVSGIFSAHHQEFSTVHLALVSFMYVLMTASKQSQDGTAAFFKATHSLSFWWSISLRHFPTTKEFHSRNWNRHSYSRRSATSEF